MGNRPVSGDQGLGRFAPGAGAEFHLGAGEVAVDGLGRNAQAQRDFLAAIAVDDEAETIPLTVGEELQLRILAWGVKNFPHVSSLNIRGKKSS
jgi:hypothetical protein